MFRPQEFLSFVLTPHTHTYLDAGDNNKFPLSDDFLIVITNTTPRELKLSFDSQSILPDYHD